MVSQDCATALQPGQEEQNSTSEKKVKFKTSRRKQATIRAERERAGKAWWLTPVTPTLWEAKVDKSLEVRILRPPGQHGKTPSLLKIQKISLVVHTCSSSYLGG